MPSHNLSALNRIVYEIEELVSVQNACEQNRQTSRNALVKGHSEIYRAHDLLHEYVQKAAELDDQIAFSCELIKQTQSELESSRRKSSEEESHILLLQREIRCLNEQMQQHNDVIRELQRRLLESGIPIEDIVTLCIGNSISSDRASTPKPRDPLKRLFWILQRKKR